MHKKHLLAFLAVFVLFGLFSSSVFLQDQFRAASGALAQYTSSHPLLGPVLFVLLAAGSVMLGPFTSTPLVPLVIPLWGIWLTLFYLLVGWIIGNILAYALGRYIGYPIARLVIPSQRLKHWLEILSHKANLPIVFLFRLATPSETGYIFGILKYSFYKYLLITIAAEIPFAVIAANLGAAFVATGWTSFAALGIVWVAIIYFAFRMLSRRLRKTS